MKRTFLSFLVALAFALVAAGRATTASAATFWWNGFVNGTSTWSSASWSTNPSTVVTATVAPGASDDVVFNIDANNGASTSVHLAATNRSANSLLFSTTGATTFLRTSSTSSSTVNLTVGVGGVTLSSTAGPVTFGAATNRVIVKFSGSSSPLTNNSSSLLTFTETASPASTFQGTTTLAVLGSGTGGVTFAGGFSETSGTNVLALSINTNAASKTSIGASSSYSGGTTLTEGIVGVGSNTALGTGTIAINGGVLASEGGQRTLANNIVVGGNFALGGLTNPITLNGSIDLGSAIRTITLKNSATLGGVVSSGGLTFAATSGQKLTLSGSNTYGLGTTVNSGTLVAGSATAFGTGGLAVNGGTVDLNGQTITVGALSGSSAAVITTNAAASIVLSSSAATNSTFAGSILNGSGTIAFTKTLGGTLTLSGSNGYSGGTTINGGALAVGNGNALGSGPVTLGGVSGMTATLASTLVSGTLTLASLSATGTTNVSLAAGSQILTTGALTFTGSNNLITLTGPAATIGNYTLLQGSSLAASGLSLTGSAVGGNTIALGSTGTTGRNTYEFTSSATALLLNVTGTTFNLVWNGTVASGTWNDTSAVWLQNGSGSPITFFNNDNTAFGTAATVAVPGAVTTGSMAISNAGGSVDLTGAGVITATTLSKTGAGAATIANSGTVVSGVTVSAGSLTVSGPLSVASGGVAVNGGSLTAGSTTTITAGGLSVGSGATYTGNGPTTISANGLSVTGGTATLGAAGTIAGGVTVNGGRLTLNAAQAVSGSVAISGGGVLGLNSGTLGSGTLSIDNGTLAAGTSGTIANVFTVGASGATINNDSTFTLAGAISGSANTITKTGNGELVISAQLGSSTSTKSQAMNLNVSAGSVTFSGNADRFVKSGTWNGNVLLTGGTLQLAGDLVGSGTIVTSGTSGIRTETNSGNNVKTIANAVTLNGVVALTANAGKGLEFDGPLSGSGAVTGTGNGIVYLVGPAGSFAGTLTVSHTAAAAYTQVTTQALGNATQVTVNANAARAPAGNLVISNTTAGEFAGSITGAGIVSISGAAKATLSGTNTFSGGTLLGGDVGIKNVSALGSGMITAATANARVLWEGSGASVTLTNNLSTGTASSFVLAFAPGSGKTIVLTGSASGSGQLKVSGGGDLDVTGLAGNTVSGGIEIGTGRILTNGANLGSGTINFGTGTNSYLVATANSTITNPFTIGSSSTVGYTGNFDTNGQNLTIAGAISDKTGNAQGGRLTKLGAGTLTLSGSNGYTGSTTISAGTLLAGNANAFGTGAVAVSGGTLDLGSLAVGNAITLASGGLVNAANYVGTQTVTGTFAYQAGSVGGTVNAVSGGIVKGSGVTFTGPVTFGDGSVHAPGNSPGTQTFAGGLTYSGSSTLQWELIANGTAGPGTYFDFVSLTGGTLTINAGAGLQPVFNGIGSAVNWNDSFWSTSHSWTVLAVGDGLTTTGAFTLLGDPSTWLDSNSVSLASAMEPNERSQSNFTIDGSSGSILLIYSAITVVPEPSTLALAGLGMAALAMRLARRRQR